MRIGRRISIAALNNNIDDDLNIMGSNGVYAGFFQVTTGIYVPAPPFNGIFLDDDAEYLSIRGGYLNPGGEIALYGRTSATPGRVQLLTLDNTLAQIEILRVVGNLALPYITLLNHRLAGVADPTTAGDALPYNVLTNWDATLVWAGATPAAVTEECYYRRIGKTVFFDIWISSADSNGTTGLTITLPSTPSNIGAAHNVSVSAWQAYGVAGTTYGNPLAYLLQSGAENRIRFLAFQTATDGQFVAVSVSGFYQEA